MRHHHAACPVHKAYLSAGAGSCGQLRYKDPEKWGRGDTSVGTGGGGGGGGGGAEALPPLPHLLHIYGL